MTCAILLTTANTWVSITIEAKLDETREHFYSFWPRDLSLPVILEQRHGWSAQEHLSLLECPLFKTSNGVCLANHNPVRFLPELTSSLLKPFCTFLTGTDDSIICFQKLNLWRLPENEIHILTFYWSTYYIIFRYIRYYIYDIVYICIHILTRYTLGMVPHCSRNRWVSRYYLSHSPIIIIFCDFSHQC